MLNKDQYNQEDYNDYYRQETEGAEISDGSEKEGGLINKLLLLLILLALGIAGYFGYKAMNKDDSTSIDTSLQVSMESSLPQTVQRDNSAEETPPSDTDSVKIEEKKVASTGVKTNVTNEVVKSVNNAKGNMSPEEVAAVVAAVMQQMNQEKISDTPVEPLAIKEDIVLMDELSDSEVDSVSADLIQELENIDLNEHKEVYNDQKQIDVYNKINVQSLSGEDTLSQLSDEINSVISEGSNTNNTPDKEASYTESLKKEVDVRKNEMRIIVVQKGDTLGRIANRAYGDARDYKKIYQANPELTRPDRIYIGQKLRIPN